MFQINIRLIKMCVLAWMLLVFSSCGGGGANQPDLQSDELVAFRAIHNPAEFSITAIPDPGIPALELAVIERSGQVVVEVLSAEPQTLSRLLFELHYDEARYTPLAAQATDAIAPLADSLCLKKLDEPGLLCMGQVPLEGTIPAVEPGSVLAEVLFALEPFEQTGTRAVSGVPVHGGALSPLVWDEQAGEYRWYYVNPGDYNQDGEVGLADLVPLGREFGAGGPFSFFSAQSLIDGNDDGQINIADLSVIGLYWGNLVEGYNFYGSAEISDVPADYDEASTLSPLASFNLSEAQGNPAVERLSYNYAPEEGQENFYSWVRPFAADTGGVPGEGTRSNINGQELDLPQQIDPNGDSLNLAPVARLTLAYTGEGVPLVVDFDASESYDPDGSIFSYEWDFEGDSLFDASGTAAAYQHTYVHSGTYAPLVRVIDDGGAWDVFQVQEFTLTEQEVGNIEPVADVIATVLSGEAPLTVGLLALGSVDPDGWIEKYEWDFDGDGSVDLDSGGDSTVLHTFTEAGAFEAEVTVTDNRGGTDSATILIEVTAPPAPNQPPQATITIVSQANTGDVPFSVDFYAGNSKDLDGEIESFRWDWDGDGTYDAFTTNPRNIHTYTVSGTYNTTLLVEDDKGATATAEVLIHANEPHFGSTTWWMYGCNSRHTSRSPFVGAQTNEVKWEFDAGDSVNSSPALGADGTVYVGSDDHNFYALNPDSSLKWSYTTGGMVRSSPAIGADGTVYVGSLDNSLYAFNPDGSLKWLYDTGTQVLSSPAIGDDGTVYVGSGHKLYALYANGNLKWSYAASGNLDYAPALGADGTVYVSCDDFNLYAINQYGSLKWTYITGGARVVSAPTIGADGTIYVGNLAGRLSAVNPNGTVKWARVLGELKSSPAIGSDGIIYAAIGSSLYALNPDGGTNWSYQMGVQLASSPAIGADGMLYLGGANSFYAVNPDGSEAWSFDAGEEVSTPPAIGIDGAVFVGTGGQLYAFGQNDPPAADLSVALNYGDVPLFVTFDASGSYDTDGGLALYEWDLDGDGLFESSSITPFATYNYVVSGVYEAMVRVSDYSGAMDTDSVMVFVNEPVTGPSAWWSFGRDNQHTRRSPFVGAQTDNVRWSYSLGAGHVSSPVMAADGTAYIKSHSSLSAVNPDGSEKWTYLTGDLSASSPAVGADGTVYVGTSDEGLLAMNPDGTYKWSLPAMGEVYSSPTIGSDGTIYAGGYDHNLYAVNPDGSEKWSYTTGGYLFSSPAIDQDGTVVVGSGDEKVYAINPDGSFKWSYQTAGSVNSSPAIGTDGTVYVGSSDHRLHAINPDGSKKWSYITRYYLSCSPAIGADGTVYVGSGGWLYAVNPDGSLKWSNSIAGASTSSPALGADGTLYLGGYDGVFSAVNPDGSLLWQHDIGDNVSSSPAIGADGTVYVGSVDDLGGGNWAGSLFAFGTP